MAEPNPKVKALFNAARRYCDEPLDRSEGIVLPGDGILDDILLEIERAVPKDFNTEEEVRSYLLDAGRRAKLFTGYTARGRCDERVIQYHEPKESERAGSEIRRAEYLQYITDLSSEQAALTKPLPYRHAMSGTKRRRVGKKLAERWDVDPCSHYWYPLWRWDQPLPPDVLAFQDAWFHKEVGVEALQNILLRRGITRVWEINEVREDPEYELDPRLCWFMGGLEMYWSSRELDWLIYASHERSMTFAGDWLINAVKEAWPNWERRIYIDYDYELPSDS
jgi:hypothetical protein